MRTTVAIDPVAAADVGPAPLKLGPGQVTRVLGRYVEVDFLGDRARAQMALGYPYEPVDGDSVLCIAQDDACYVIGILAGRGRVRFVAPGDLELRAPRGRIDLISERGIRMKSRDISITAGNVAVVARSIMETFTEASRWVKDAFQIRAGRMRSKVDGDFRLNAGEIVERAQGEVKIDGTKIHLG